MRLLAVLLLIVCFKSFTHAQHNPKGEVSTTMVEVMDSLLEEFQYRQRYAEKTDTLRLNKYRFAPHEIPRYTPEEIRARMREIPSVVPLAYNAKVQTFIDVYSVRLRKLTSKMLGLQQVYFPMIEEVLHNEGLPDELKYVACIESALHPRAVSPAKAVGLWQFIHGTGKMYKMRIDSYVDERLDPYKASVAGARYLKDLHKIYNDWPLAIAAYNCGPGRVNYAIKRAGGSKDFWELYKYLPSETASYVPAFIACMYVMKFPAEHNLYPIWADFTYQQDTLHIQDMQVSLEEMARVSGHDPELIRNLNPELKLGIVPYSKDKVYVLRVPNKMAEFYRTGGFAMIKKHVPVPVVTNDPFLAKKKTTPAPVADAGNNGTVKWVLHRVQSGETPEMLAEKYKVSAQDIRTWNKIKGPWLFAGHTIRIQQPTVTENTAVADKTTHSSNNENASDEKANLASNSTSPAQAPNPNDETNGNNVIYYRVQKGDTLWTIANKHKVATIDKLVQDNGLRKNAILQVGQVIKIVN